MTFDTGFTLASALINSGTFRYNSSVAYNNTLTFTSGSIGGDNTGIYLTHTVVPEPRAALLGGLGLLMLLRRRRA